jgi:hypothetical protein
VVGVGHALRGDRPGLVPLHARLVEQQAHQLGHRDGGWVSFIWNTLCSANFDRSLLPAAPLAHRILQAGRGQEILLAQAQFLAALAGVVGIQHHRNVLGVVLFACTASV